MDDTLLYFSFYFRKEANKVFIIEMTLSPNEKHMKQSLDSFIVIILEKMTKKKKVNVNTVKLYFSNLMQWVGMIFL